jgi:hypothetical protein
MGTKTKRNWMREIKLSLDRLSFEKQLVVLDVAMYMAWRNGIKHKDMTARKIFNGAWEYHIAPLRKKCWDLRDAMGNEGIVGALSILAYCVLMFAAR